MTNPVEPVIAGSRGFALALLAPLTERIGMRPRIAADPGRARAFCGDAGGLVVVEFLGGDTLQAIRELVHDAKGVRVVAAVPEKLASADASLRALGVDVARWDGTAASVLDAVGRQLATAASQATPRAGGTMTSPPPGPPLRAPVAPTPQPVTAAPARATPRPPAAASAPARAPAPPVASAEPPAPAHEAPPAAPRAPSPAPAARVAAVPVVGIRRTPLPATASTLAAEPRALEEPAPAVPVGPRLTPVAPAAAEPAWPATVPSQAEAAAALDRAIAGLPPTAAVITEVIAALSDLERVVLAGGEVPVDPEPIRQAAVMRVRVAAALATVPPPGGAVDEGAVSALLAEIDALLGRVSALAAGATPELAPALDAVRNALVREAIGFSEAAQRVSAAAPGGEAAAVHASVGRIRTRLLSEDRAPEKVRRGNVAVFVALAVAVALAGAYHAWNWRERQTVRATLTKGLPAGLTEIPGPPGGPRVLVRATTTEVPDPAEVARLKAVEEARGNLVRESDGMIFIEPAPREPPPPAPAAVP